MNNFDAFLTIFTRCFTGRIATSILIAVLYANEGQILIPALLFIIALILMFENMLWNKEGKR